MNCSDSTPGPVIVKYEDDVPQISGKPCIDFQPDDRWQIKDDDDDCKVDTPSKKSVVNDSKKSKGHNDEKTLDSAVNGDSEKIITQGKEGHKKKESNDSHATVKEEPIPQNDSHATVKEEPIPQNDSHVIVKEEPIPQNDSHVIIKEPIPQSDSEVKVSHLTEEKSTENCSSKDKTEPEIMHILPPSLIKIEQSDSSSVNEKHENTASVDGKETEDKNSMGEKEKICENEGSLVVSSTESSKTANEDDSVSTLDKQPSPNGTTSIDVKAEEDETSVNSDGESANMPSSKSSKDETKSKDNHSSKATIEESPPKLENHTTSSDAVQASHDMPDISSGSFGTVTDTKLSEGSSIKNSEKPIETDTANKNDTQKSANADTANKSVTQKSGNADGTSNKDAFEEVETDWEVQVISSTSDPNKDMSKELSNKSQEKIPYDVALLNSLKGVLKAGQYKPVKFPHTGTLSLAENEVIIESPSLLVPLLIKEADVFPQVSEGQPKTDEQTAAAATTTKKPVKPPVSKNFFESSVGKFLISLGMGRVEEWYHRDMKRSKLKHIKKYGPDEKVEEEFHKHQKDYLKAKEANGVFSFRLRRCQFCDFKSESLSVMEAHYLIPHLSPRKEYKCNYCVFLTRDPKEIIFHFEAMHGKKAVLDFVMPFHECPFCCFQSHLKTKVNAHINRCRKHFMPTHNQAPPFDFEFPGVTTKPVTMADILAHRAIMNAAKSRPNQPVYTPPNAVPKGINVRNKLALINKISNQNSVNNVQSSPLVKQLVGQQPKPIQPVNAATGIHLPPGLVITRPRANISQVQNSVRLTSPRIATATIRHQANTRKWVYNSTESQLASSGISITPVTKVASQGVWTPNINNAVRQTMKNITLTPISTSGNQVVSQKPGPPQPVALFTNVAGNDSRNGNRGPVIMSVQSQATRMPVGTKIGSPRIHIPYQRLNTPPSQVVKGSSGNTFVMCEICDSYIKDLEELRTHMNWVHKVKIHPKMLVSRPPLNCQKCQWRFFTDQGLERHLLGAHGLVTTNMQEMANKNQDGGRCIICGAVFTYKLVSHMTQVHKVTLKPAHLSYKCTVCTATFTLYRLFESHVYNVHSGSAKRPAEEQPASEPPSKKANVVPTPPERKQEVREVVLEKCKECDVKVEDLNDHLIKKHLKKCSVKLCHIEKCEKCLYSTDEILVIRMSDFGIEDDDDDSDDDDEDDDEDDGDISTIEMKDDVPDSAVESGADKA